MIVKNCAFCGEEFSVEVSSKNQKFCSKTCARKNQHRKSKNLEKAVPMLKNEIIPEWNIVIYTDKQFFTEDSFIGTAIGCVKKVQQAIQNESKIKRLDIHLRRNGDRIIGSVQNG